MPGSWGVHGVGRGRDAYFYDLSRNWGWEGSLIMCYKNTALVQVTTVYIVQHETL